MLKRDAMSDASMMAKGKVVGLIGWRDRLVDCARTFGP